MNKTVFQAVDEFYNLVNAAPSTEAATGSSGWLQRTRSMWLSRPLQGFMSWLWPVNGSAKPKNVLHELFSFFLSCSGRFSMPTINVSRAAGMCL